jgi:hypothetical protein
MLWWSRGHLQLPLAIRRGLLVLFGAILLCSQPALATETVLASVPRASVVGRGVLSFAFWDVYKATLYAPDGQFGSEKPIALTIEYLISINGRDIADRSVQEMRKQGFADEAKLADWNAQLKVIFPDVRNGTVLSAVYQPGEQTAFYNGSTAIGTIAGDDFGRLFFGIWLGERTSEPKLRRALLGLS